MEKKKGRKTWFPLFTHFFLGFQNYYYKLTRVEVISQAIMIPLDMDE